MKVTHDLHTHTLLSSCCEDQTATAENYIRKAAELGHRTFGISNHLWDEAVAGSGDWYHKQSILYVLTEKPLIRALDPCGMKVLFGAETEYLGKSDTLAFTAANAHRFDYILIPHTHTHMQGFVIAEMPEVIAYREEFLHSLKQNYPWMREDLCRQMAENLRMDDMPPEAICPRKDYELALAEYLQKSFEQLLANPEFEKITKEIPVIIAHPFFPCGENVDAFIRIYGMLDEGRMRRAFEKAARMGVAFDINICSYQMINDLPADPMVKIMRLAKECGVKFAFGTDAHSVSALADIRHGDAIADAIGVTEDDLCDLV